MIPQRRRAAVWQPPGTRSNDTSYQAVTPGGKSLSGNIEYPFLFPRWSALPILHGLLQSGEGQASRVTLFTTSLRGSRIGLLCAGTSFPL